MTSLAQKRILNDYQILIKNSELLHDSGIFYQFDEDDIFKMKAMIIGPSDTPYENGFYCFNITFPKEYPNLPPKFVYCTNYRNVRFNPNLYTNGNVCLSLLNTWSGSTSGEGWTASNNIMVVFTAIQGMVMNEHPLINEPGFETVCKDHRRYNEILQHENFYTAVHRMITMPENGFECFSDIMKKYFVEHYQWYLDKTLEYYHKYKNKPVFSCSYQGNKVNNDYIGIYKKFIALGKQLSEELSVELEIPDPMTQTKLLTLDSEADTKKETETKVVDKNAKDKCQGKTNKGFSCKFKAKKNGYCTIHQELAKTKT